MNKTVLLDLRSRVSNLGIDTAVQALPHSARMLYSAAEPMFATNLENIVTTFHDFQAASGATFVAQPDLLEYLLELPLLHDAPLTNDLPHQAFYFHLNTSLSDSQVTITSDSGETALFEGAYIFNDYNALHGIEGEHMTRIVLHGLIPIDGVLRQKVTVSYRIPYKENPVTAECFGACFAKPTPDATLDEPLKRANESAMANQHALTLVINFWNHLRHSNVVVLPMDVRLFDDEDEEDDELDYLSDQIGMKSRYRFHLVSLPKE